VIEWDVSRFRNRKTWIDIQCLLIVARVSSTVQVSRGELEREWECVCVGTVEGGEAR
jgi:hypothetical protein